MDYPGKHAQDGPGTDPAGDPGVIATPDFSPLYVDGVVPEGSTSGLQQFWWLADSVPMGRQLVIAMLALGLVGVGFVAGRSGQRVIVQQVNVPILAPRDGALLRPACPAAAGLCSMPASIILRPPRCSKLCEFQPRLPWEEAPTYLDRPGWRSTPDKQITVRNYRSMEEYVRRSHSTPQHLQRRPARRTTSNAAPGLRASGAGRRPARHVSCCPAHRCGSRHSAQWAQVTVQVARRCGSSEAAVER